MAITNTTLASPTYNGNGATTAFATGFQFIKNSDLLVIVTSSTGVETVQTITTHYTVTGAGLSGGGTVTFVAAPAAGTKVNIRSNVIIDQQTDYLEGGSFSAATHEDALDKLTKISQQIKEITDRSLKLPSANQSIATTLTAPTATYVLRLSADGTALEWASPATVALGTTVSAYAQTLLDDADASASRTTLGLGTIATQAANNVAITGGSITGITDMALADGGTGASLADPGADRIMFWDDSAGAVTWLTAGTNLTITGTTINASGGGAAFTQDIALSSHGFVVGDLLYLNGSVYAKAIATSAAAAEVVGIVSAVIDTNNFTLQFGGRITGLSGLTVGEVYFLHTTAGQASITEPSTAGQISKPVYIADTTTTAILTLESRGSIRSSVGVLTEATQSDMETATSTSTYVSPSKARFHPSAAKAWLVFDASSGTPTIGRGYNHSSFTDNGVGDFTINFTTAFSDTNYVMIGITDAAAGATRNTTPDVDIHTRSTGSCRILTHDTTSTAADFVYNAVAFFGDY